MTSEELADRLDQYQRFGVKLGLENMRALCAAMGHPESRTPAVHIAGTNGKGSTAACLDAVLRAASYRVGRYVSPHLCDVTERIAVDGVRVTPGALCRALDDVQKAERAAGDTALRATYFEVLTAAAFHIFAKRMIDIGIYEVGMGGRLDATNVLDPVATCITTVASDHTAHLGTAIREIAVEKAGIIKPGIPVVCGDLVPEAVESVASVAESVGAPTVRYGVDFGVRPGSREISEGFQTATWWSCRGEDIEFRLPLRGAWQLKNAACALALAQTLVEQGWKIPSAAMEGGLDGVQWPGRVEWLSREPGVLFDSAHNPAAVAAVVETVHEECPGGAIPVLAVLADKDADAMCRALAGLGPSVVVSAANHERALAVERLAAVARQHFTTVLEAPSLSAGLALAHGLDSQRPVFVVGSLMNYAETRTAVKTRVQASL